MNKISHLLLKDSLGVIILITAAFALSLLINMMRDDKMPLLYKSKMERVQSAVESIQTSDVNVSSKLSAVNSENSGKAVEISTGTLRKMVSEDNILILDARPEIFHRIGHIPKAISLPRESFEESYTKMKDKVDQYKSLPVVIYCSGSSCEDSHMVAEALLKLRFEKIYVYSGGWSEWTQEGLPEEKNE